MKLSEMAVYEQPTPNDLENGEPVALNLVNLLLYLSPEVEAAIMVRSELGVRRYGVPLHTNDGRNTAADLAQELLDAILYAHKGVIETGHPTYKHIRARLNALLVMLKDMPQ